MNKPLSLLLATSALFSAPLLADTDKQETIKKIQSQVSAWIDIQVAPQSSIIQKWSLTVNSTARRLISSLQMAVKAVQAHTVSTHKKVYWVPSLNRLRLSHCLN